MLNKLGTTENMIEYHENGNKSYEFKTSSNGVFAEETFDKNGNILTYKSSNGYSSLFTRDEYGHELAFRDTKGCYIVKDKDATQQEYEAFIQSL